MINGNNICFFASYFKGSKLPYYIRVYLKELKKHLNEVVLLCVAELNEESLGFLNSNNITLQGEVNQGFDFGLWYKAFQKVSVEKYDRVFLVNDSCVLFRSLDPFMSWMQTNDADVKGITMSEAVNVHVQSYFMVLNNKTVQLAAKYFKQHGVKKDIEEVIKVYELGMSKFFTDSGLKLSAFVDNNGYKGEFSPYYKCVDHHLAQGCPMIKKKILMASYRKEELPNITRMGLNVHPDHYYNFMSSQPDLVINLTELKAESPVQMGSLQIVVYNIKKALIKFFRPIYKSFKK